MTDLSSRIAAALESPPSDAPSIASLITEAVEALKVLEHTQAAQEGRLLDPRTPDGEVPALRALVADDTFRAKRLAAGVDQLRALHEAALQRQRERVRQEHRAQVLAERDATAQALTENYGRLASELAALLHRTAESEAACAKINAPGPESLARNLSGHDVHKLTTGVILPDFTLSEHKVGRGHWPPVQRRQVPVTTNMTRRSEELG